MMVKNSKKSISVLEIRVFSENGLESFYAFLIYRLETNQKS
jgi:hypothetical protein